MPAAGCGGLCARLERDWVAIQTLWEPIILLNALDPKILYYRSPTPVGESPKFS